MIVTRGLGRGGSGSLVAHGLTRRSRVEMILDALESIALQVMSGICAAGVLNPAGTEGVSNWADSSRPFRSSETTGTGGGAQALRAMLDTTD